MAKSDPNILTPAEKREWKTAIQRRQATMLSALDNQLSGTIDHVIAELRAQRGLVISEAELTDLITNIDDQIKAEISKFLASEKRRVEIRIEETNDDYDTKEREMKIRHKKEWEDLGKERKTNLDGLRDELRNAEEKVAKEHTGELLERKREYHRQLLHAREAEKHISVEAENRIRIMGRSKAKLSNLITDAGGRALEQLLLINTREEANALLVSIPTVSEALDMCSSIDGIGNLMKRLDPRFLLAGPSQPVGQADQSVQPDQPDQPDQAPSQFIESVVVSAGQEDDVVDGVEIPSIIDNDAFDTRPDYRREDDHAEVYYRRR